MSLAEIEPNKRPSSPAVAETATAANALNCAARACAVANASAAFAYNSARRASK